MEILKLEISFEFEDHLNLRQLEATNIELGEVLELTINVNYNGENGWLSFDIGELYQGTYYLDSNRLIGSNFNQKDYQAILSILHSEPIKVLVK